MIAWSSTSAARMRAPRSSSFRCHPGAWPKRQGTCASVWSTARAAAWRSLSTATSRRRCTPSRRSAGLAIALTLNAKRPGQAMTVLWNEQPLAHLQVGETLERRTLSLPTAAVRAGENRLRVHFARPAPSGEPTAVIHRVEVGPRASIIAGPASTAVPYTVAPATASAATLDLSPGTALVYYLIPPRRGRLRLDVRGRGSLRVRVSTDADHREGRPPTALLEEPLRPTGGQHELDLAGYGGVPLRLELAVGGAGEDSAAPRCALAARGPPLDAPSTTAPQDPRPLRDRRRGRPPRRPARRPAPRPALRPPSRPHPVGPRVRPRLRQRALGRAQPQRAAVGHGPAGARDRAGTFVADGQEAAPRAARPRRLPRRASSPPTPTSAASAA
jgi:hypothetical protein